MTCRQRLRLAITLLIAAFTNITDASAQISMSKNADGATTTYLAGQIPVPNGLMGMYAAIDNKTFTCTLIQQLKDGDLLPAMVSTAQAFSIDRVHAGYPLLAMIKGPDGEHRALMPALLKFKIDIQPGEVLHSDNLDIETTRKIKAGDSVTVLYINGPVILSVEAAEEDRKAPEFPAKAKPWFTVFYNDINTKSRSATIDVWRVETNYVHH